MIISFHVVVWFKKLPLISPFYEFILLLTELHSSELLLIHVKTLSYSGM